MTVLNFLQNSPLIQWAILLLSASSLVLTLTLAVKNLILPTFSTLTKSQKESLTSFLKSLSNFSMETLPNLSNALKITLLNHELLPTSNNVPQDSQDSQDTPDSQDSQMSSLLKFLEEFKNAKY